MSVFPFSLPALCHLDGLGEQACSGSAGKARKFRRAKGSARALSLVDVACLCSQGVHAHDNVLGKLRQLQTPVGNGVCPVPLRVGAAAGRPHTRRRREGGGRVAGEVCGKGSMKDSDRSWFTIRPIKQKASRMRLFQTK